MKAPVGYVAPEFPALVWPSSPGYSHAFLYSAQAAWWFTAAWATLLSGGVHALAGLWLLGTHWRAGRRGRLVLVAAGFVLWGALTGFLAGSLLGVLIGTLYDAAQFRLTPWVPFVWGVNVVVYAVLSSYSFYVGII